MKISYKTTDGRLCKSTDARLTLINWYFDEIAGDQDSVVFVNDKHTLFIQQLASAIERKCGRCPRVDSRKTQEDQYLYLLRYIHHYGAILDLIIS